MLFATPGMLLAGPEQTSQEILEQSDKATAMHEKEGSWLPVPIPVSNPTIGTGLQVVLLYLHPKSNETSPNATSGLAAMYTDTRSYQF